MNEERYKAIITLTSKTQSFVGEKQASDLLAGLNQLSQSPVNQPIYSPNKLDLIIKISNTLGITPDELKEFVEVNKGENPYLTFTKPGAVGTPDKTYEIKVFDCEENKQVNLLED